MELVFKTSDEPPYQPGKDLSVLVACLDVTASMKAWEILELLQQKLQGEEGRILHQWWNTEVLTFHALREQLATEATVADMIIMGIHAGRELPEHLTRWMERLLELRKDRPGALVAVLDSEVKRSIFSQEMLSQLKQAAASGNMDFFATRARTGSDAAVMRRASEVARRCFVTRKCAAQPGLPVQEPILTATSSAPNQALQPRL